MIETDTTLFEVRDRCAWITLNRPESLNSLNPELRWQLSQHLDRVEADVLPDQKAAIVNNCSPWVR